MKPGKFITIEGTEGAGKSTALQLIHDFFKQQEKEVVLTREPGGTPLAEAIRDLLLHAKLKEAVANETELLLMFAARSQHIAEVIRPGLEKGKWLVCDRFIDATYAYQGGGRGIDLKQIQLLDQLVVGALYPDLTLLLDLPVEIGFARAEKRGADKDRIEQEKMDFFKRVREAYLMRAKADPKRIKVIDASQNLDTVRKQIEMALSDFIRDNT